MKKLVLFISTNFDKSRVNDNFFNGKYDHLFDEIKIYNENDLPDYIKSNIKTNIEKYGPRGYGYWCWKPYMILNELKQLNDNDILIHLDAHCFLENIENKLDEYFELLQTMEKPLLTGYCWIANDLMYTTKNLIAYVEEQLNYKFTYEELKEKQAESGILFMRKNKFIMNFISLWDKLLNDGIEYISDNYNAKELNYPDFIDHRHDQSLLSLLCKYYKIPVFKDFNWDDLNRVDGKQISYKENK